MPDFVESSGSFDSNSKKFCALFWSLQVPALTCIYKEKQTCKKKNNVLKGRKKRGAGEIGYWVRVLTVLGGPEVQPLAPTGHLTTTYNYSSRESNALSDAHRLSKLMRLLRTLSDSLIHTK